MGMGDSEKMSVLNPNDPGSIAYCLTFELKNAAKLACDTTFFQPLLEHCSHFKIRQFLTINP